MSRQPFQTTPRHARRAQPQALCGQRGSAGWQRRYTPRERLLSRLPAKSGVPQKGEEKSAPPPDVAA